MPAKVLLFNEEAMITRLRAKVERAGSQSEFARKVGVERVTLNQVLRGHLHIPPSMWSVLKIKRIYLSSARQLNATGVLSLLRSEIKRAGGLSAWSLKTGIHRSVVSKVLHRRRPITQSVLGALDVRSALTSSLSSSAEKGQAVPSRSRRR
jgi:DNA-binding phage protein